MSQSGFFLFIMLTLPISIFKDTPEQTLLDSTREFTFRLPDECLPSFDYITDLYNGVANLYEIGVGNINCILFKRRDGSLTRVECEVFDKIWKFSCILISLNERKTNLT